MIKFIKVNEPNYSIEGQRFETDQLLDHVCTQTSLKDRLPIKRNRDNSFGVQCCSRDGGKEYTYLGDCKISFDKESNEFLLENESSQESYRYPYTDKLLELMTHKDPNGYSESEMEMYKDIVGKTNLLKSKERSNGKKWRNIIRPMWSERVVISSCPDILKKQLQTLVASREAGNTGVYNEIITIVDELTRQGEISNENSRQLLTLLR